VDNVDNELAASDWDLSAAAVEMLPAMDLSDYFTSVPPRKSLHIIVELPSCESSAGHTNQITNKIDVTADTATVKRKQRELGGKE